jgi:hypothetical protein
MPIKCYTCGKLIKFDDKNVSPSGKKIPMNMDGTDHSHGDYNTNTNKSNQQQQYSKHESGQTFTPKDIPRTSQGGLPLDTKRLLQAVVELTKEFRDFKQELQSGIVMVDSARYDNQMKVIYEVIAPLLRTQKTAADYLKEENPELVNHAKKADRYMDFMESKKNATKFVDESRERDNLDERIPDSADEMLGAIEDDNNDQEGVINDE